MRGKQQRLVYWKENNVGRVENKEFDSSVKNKTHAKCLETDRWHQLHFFWKCSDLARGKKERGAIFQYKIEKSCSFTQDFQWTIANTTYNIIAGRTASTIFQIQLQDMLYLSYYSNSLWDEFFMCLLRGRFFWKMSEKSLLVPQLCM